MPALRGTRIELVPLSEAVEKLRTVPPEDYEVAVAVLRVIPRATGPDRRWRRWGWSSSAGATPGCATPGSGIQAGEHVTVYVSMPLRGPEAAEGRDVVRAAKLALADAQGKGGGARGARRLSRRHRRPRRPRSLEPGGRRRKRPDGGARTHSAIAYLGDFDSGATRASLPITNEARMLQVSPASAAVDLVQPFLGAGDQVPEEVQATGERTFGRVIPSDEVQAEAAAGWAKRLGARRVGTVSDGSEFGRTMVRAFRQSLPGATLTRGRDPDLLYYGGAPDDACRRRV